MKNKEKKAEKIQKYEQINKGKKEKTKKIEN